MKKLDFGQLKHSHRILILFSKNRIKIPREIFPVGETKYAVLDSNMIISCSVYKKVSNYIHKKYLMMFLRKMKIPWDFTP